MIDLSQTPALAAQHQIIAAPTLVRELPLPERRFIGDMSNAERILAGLDVVARPAEGAMAAPDDRELRAELEALRARLARGRADARRRSAPARSTR